MGSVDYRVFDCGCIGEAHLKRELPMQDHYGSLATENYDIAVISDGHGNRRHFRSDRGSEIACSVTIDVISSYLDRTDDVDDMDSFLNSIKTDIVKGWKETVRNDQEKCPWTEAELEEQRNLLTDEGFDLLTNGVDTELPYGCTLCAVFRWKLGWAAIQVGDGSFALVDKDRFYSWPMPISLFNEGNKTYSLCAPDPMLDFRHVYGSEDFIAAVVYSDGIEKVYNDDSREIISFIYWLCNNRIKKADTFDRNLQIALHNITSRSPIGDDISIAGIIDVNSDDIIPRLSESQIQNQKENEMEAIYSKLDEINNTISYNMQRLYNVKYGGVDASADLISQIQQVIDRNKQESIRLLTVLAEMKKGD